MQGDSVDLLGVGAVYHRVSGDKQDMDRQREATSKFLKDHGVTVSREHVYEDENWARDEADVRPDFQRMMGAVDAKRINWIVIDHRTRFGTKDKWQRLKYVIRLKDSACRLYTASGENLTGDSLLDVIQTGMDGEASEKELREKAEGVVGGKSTRAADGEWMGGHIPYGCCVICVDADRRKERWRVEIVGRDMRLKIDADKAEERYDGKGNFPPAGQTERLELRPSSDPERLKVVQDVFQWYMSERIGFSTIARRLNKMGILTQYGEIWRSGHVVNLLANPTYIGKIPWNRHSTAKYVEFCNGRKKVVDKNDFGVWRKRDKKDWVLSRPLFEPMVPTDVFEAAQKKMANHAVYKSPRSPKMWLSGLLFCGHCGKPMRANARKKRKEGKKDSYMYVCSTYSKNILAGKRTCERHFIHHESAEQAIHQYLEDAGISIREQGKTTGKTGFYEAVGAPTVRMREAVREMRRRLGIPDDQRGNTVPDVIEQYTSAFMKDRPRLLEKREQLQGEHDLLTNNLLRLPSSASRALTKAQVQIVEIEGKLTEVDNLLKNAAETCEQAMDDLMTQVRSWDAARVSLADDVSGRRKAEAISKVIKGVYYWFRPTGRKTPRVEVDHYKVVPVGRNEDEPPNNGDGEKGPKSGGGAIVKCCG